MCKKKRRKIERKKSRKGMCREVGEKVEGYVQEMKAEGENQGDEERVDREEKETKRTGQISD
jgi:hypothetical protein